MHLFQLSKEYPGELEFCYPWLPYWIVHNRELLDKVSAAVKAALPKGLTVKDLTGNHFSHLDEVAIDTICQGLPFVTGLKEMLMALVQGIEMDPSKAPKHKAGGKAAGKVTPPENALAKPPGLE